MSRSETLSKSWKKREAYLGEKKNHPLYNMYRGFRFTIKGKGYGNSKNWNNYKNFYNDMINDYFDGATLWRKDKTKEYSKDNCVFVTKEELYNLKCGVLLTVDGVTKTLKEWSEYAELSYNGIRQRYHKGKNYTPEEIVYGKKKIKKTITCSKELKYKEQRIKASKMMSQYRLKDKKKDLKNNLNDIDWFIDNIFNQECSYCGSKERIGADRIDNTKGHTIINIVPACYDCNTMRNNNFSFEEMKKIGKFVKIEILDKR